ncbi:Protein phosphatase 1E [Habropoda laboriosa]|uniref:Protein phosphatase 1E n=1 Tax=Habropoda laboriosa TaxID=597456 RepID=A0A0L7R161_9HYME|nr:Protein phosphatase 1E [Habropoda laboriosa]
MAEDCTDGDYLGAYSRFFSEFVARVNPHDQLPVSVSSYNVTEAEIVGEIINVTLQYLNQTQCPPSLQAHLVHQVIQEIKSMCKKQPEDCGFKSQEKTYTSLKLMQAITGKVNEICIRYLDNSRLALLPPPPSIPLPQAVAVGTKNCRRKMEDRHVVLHDLHTIFGIEHDSTANYYAVFDGHAGQDAAVYCATHLHQYLAENIYYPTDPEQALLNAFLTTDAQFIEKSEVQKVCGGTTAVCSLILNKNLYVAWVGDSTATLIKRDSVVQLVKPHRLNRTDEVRRIKRMGGVVQYSMGTMRVNGTLGVSRAIGDVPYKPFVTGEPEIKTIPLDGTEDFLVLASDGLTDYLKPDEILTILYFEIQQNPNGYKRAPQILLQWAKHLGSKDNITVVVVLLTPANEIAARSQNNHWYHRLQVCYLFEKMNSKDKPFLDIDDAHNATNSNILKQTVISQEPHDRDRDRDRDHEDDGILAASNGKHENGDADYDNSDLGPETVVDDGPVYGGLIGDALVDMMVARFMPVLDQCLGLIKDNDSNHDQKPLQHALIHEADNVADSEDSEDEWNYYRVDPNKEKGSTVPIDIPQESKNEEEETEIIPELPVDTTDRMLKIQSQDTEEDIKCESPKTETPELINTEISAEDKAVKTEGEEKAREEEQEKPKDMDFQLNPNAAEFVPVSPQFLGGTRVNLVEDYPVSGSPFKQVPQMDDIQVPSQSEFEKEVCQRPREVDVDVEVEEKEYQNGDRLQSTDYTDFLSDQQKSVSVTGNLDDSEISSTKAEFGDESAASFLTTSEFHRTGISTVDESFSSSERDYDIAKDPMAMSFTPSDFEAAFDKGVDLNAVHNLSSTDLEEKNGNIEDEDKIAEQSSLELQLETTDLMVVPEAEEPTEEKPALPEEPTELVNLVVEEIHEEVKKEEPKYDAAELEELLKLEVENDLCDIEEKEEVTECILEAEIIEAEMQELEIQKLKEKELETNESEIMKELETMESEMVKELEETEAEMVKELEVKEPEMVKELEVKEPEMMKELEVKEPEMVKELETNESEIMKELEAMESEMVKELKETEAEMVKELEVKEPEMVKESEVEEPEIMKELEIKELEMVKEVETNESEIMKELEAKESEMVKELEETEAKMVKELEVEEPEMVKELEVKEPEMMKELEVKEPEIVKEAEMVEELEVKEAEMVKELEVKEPEIMKELETKEGEMVKESEVKEPEIMKELETKEAETIVELETKYPEMKEEPEVKDIKVEDSVVGASENKIAGVATAALVAAVATGGTVAQSKSKVKTTGAKATTKTTGQKAPPKSTQTSPSKSAISTTRTSTATAKKPSTTAPARPKDLDAPKKSTALSSASSNKTSTSVPKSGSKTTTSTGTTKTTTRTSSGAVSKPKPTAAAAVSSKPTAIEKKPTANGDVKSLNKATATKPASKAPSTSKSALVKTSNPRPTTGSTATTKLKPTSSSTATKSSTTAKSSTSNPSTTSITATSTTTVKAKVTPTVGNATTKPRTPTTTKSPMIDKQVKETANKQISMARTSTGASKTSSRLFTSSSATTTTKRVSLTTKTSTTASPTKKTTAVSKVSSKISTAGKTITEKGKIMQNGVSDKVEINAIFDDVPKKDLSPVVAPNDNQLIMSSD